MDIKPFRLAVGADPEVASDEFDVEAILGARGRSSDGDREYLVHWANFPSEFDEWVAEENLSAPLLVSKADNEFPEAPLTRAHVAPAEWVLNLKPVDVAAVTGVRETRRGTQVELQLTNSKNRRLAFVHDLPADVCELPAVQRVLKMD